MKLHLAAIAGVSALALSLSACSGGETPTASTGGETSAAAPADICNGQSSIKLTVWGPSQEQASSSDWLPTMEENFKKANTGCTIEFENAVVAEGDAGTKVSTDPASAADVYMFANDQLGVLIDSGAIGVLSPEVTETVKANNDDAIVKSVTGSDGQIYGVPFTGNTWFMYYNKSKFSEDDVKSLDTMLEKGKVTFPVDNSWYIWAFYAGAGGSLFGPDGTDEAAGIDLGAKATDVTKYLVALAGNKNFADDSNSSGLGGLASGKTDVVFSGTWDANNVKEALGDNYAAAQPPTYKLDGSDVQLKAFFGSKAIAFNPLSKAPLAASAFAAYLGSTEAQKAHFEMNAVVPSDKSLATDSAVVADPAAKAQMETISNASTIQPTIAKMGDFWTPAETFGKAIISGDVTDSNAQAKTEAWASQYK
ncbi:MAG: extracellular solute-binding protein [Propionibacteriaceae bacterium]|jgi:arabinogalactan oligomer/maltooligosaccharide transport system substrate-binding protein|nr:extracellular solute-binding protein [Propionibacteriaceae bacterium]